MSLKTHLHSWLAGVEIFSFNPNSNMISIKHLHVVIQAAKTTPVLLSQFILLLCLGPPDTAADFLWMLQASPHCGAGDKALAN